MALILSHSVCAICHGALDAPYTATSGVTFSATHPLHPYCDAPLHFHCLEEWPSRREFAQGYLENARTYYRGLKTLLADSSEWILGAGPYTALHFEAVGLLPPTSALAPDAHPAYLDIYLGDWPIRLYAQWNDWPEYLAGGYRNGITESVLPTVEDIIAEIRSLYPDSQALCKALSQAL